MEAEEVAAYLVPEEEEEATTIASVREKCWTLLLERLDATTTMDSGPRFEGAVSAVRAHLFSCAVAVPETLPEAFVAVQSFSVELEKRAVRLYRAVRDEYSVQDNGDGGGGGGGGAEDLLGRGSRRMYVYVKKELGIPFLGPNTLATPRAGSDDRGFRTGDMVARARESMARGGLYGVVVECLKDFEGAAGKG